MKINNIIIFCGANTGTDPIYEESAYALGQLLAEKEIGIIFGGGAVGLMGAVADGALSKGGTVTGVIPQFLVDREMAHPEVQHMEVVESMHERKARMETLGDAIITLPGGAGTMEEFFEMFTWGQIGLQKKPIGLLDVNNFFDALTSLFEKLIEEGFLDEKYMGQLFIGDDANEILKSFEVYKPIETRTYETGKTTSLGRRFFYISNLYTTCFLKEWPSIISGWSNSSTLAMPIFSITWIDGQFRFAARPYTSLISVWRSANLSTPTAASVANPWFQCFFIRRHPISMQGRNSSLKGPSSSNTWMPVKPMNSPVSRLSTANRPNPLSSISFCASTMNCFDASVESFSGKYLRTSGS